MSKALTSRTIFEGPLVSVADVRCVTPKSPVGPEEPSRGPALIFPRRGVFELQVDGRSMIADCNSVVLCNVGETQRYAHPCEGGDDCTVLAFAAPMLREALDGAGRTAGGEARPFPTGQLIVPAAAQYRLRLALHALSAYARDALAVEELAAGILRTVFAELHDSDDSRPRTAAARRRDTEFADGVRSVLASRPGDDLSLSALAQNVHATPFHLARRFRAATGTSIHQYRLQMRFALAFDRIAGGCDDLAALAAELGFAHHAHFSAGFRRAFGMTPSALRRARR